MYVELTDAELIVLDGRCEPATQEKVNDAKAREVARHQHADLRPEWAAFIADVVSEAKREGRLVRYWTNMRHCRGCGASSTYPVYKTGRRAGKPKRTQEIMVYGVELARRFVVITGIPTLGVCRACWEGIQPHLATVLADVEAEIPEAITGYPPRYRRWELRKCLKCEWQGHEGQSLPFGGKAFDHLPGHAIVRANP